MTKQVDYIVLGQGICGTFVSHYLVKAGKKVLVIDEQRAQTASKVASGIINPVTGRRIVRTWRIEEMLPFALEAYTAFGNELGENIISQISVLDFHPTLQMKEAFEKRLKEGETFLQIPHEEVVWHTYFNYHFGIGKIAPCLLVDVNTMLIKWRQKLINSESLLQETFSLNDCTVKQDQVVYKNFKANKIICCEGAAGFNNPYFKNLPYSHMKGEAIIASIKGLPADAIYKHGLSIVHWKDDLFWIGSSYEWEFKDLLPTPAFKQKVEAFLKQFIKLPFTIIDHLAADRPANMERRPFVGVHPKFPPVAILNGMGTKGCSLAPFFAHQLVNHLLNGQEIYADADVQRFTKVLARTML